MAYEMADKWSCSQCTYANYQSSKVCTMCRNLRHPVIITEPPCTSATTCLNDDAQQRWRCSTCTYMNVLRAKRCTICLGNRSADFDFADNIEDKEEDDNRVDASEIEKLGKALRKWDCTRCTYLNWPSVKQCVMCGMSDDAISKDTLDDGAQGPEKDDAASGGTLATSDTYHTENEEAADSFAPNELETAACCPWESEDTKDLTNIEIYLLRLQNAVDTGCYSFLGVVSELLRRGPDVEDKLVNYIYKYGEGSRQINSLESMVLSEMEGNNGEDVYGHTLIDVVRSRTTDLLMKIPRFFMESLSCSVAFPGLAGGDRAEEILKHIRNSVYEDCDMTRIKNFSALFTLPIVIYDLKPWVSSGDNSLRILLDIDDRQLLSTVCFVDAHYLPKITEYHTFSPVLLRNRGGGHSLVDAVSQALWGIVDKNNILRSALYRTLHLKEADFRSRWAASTIKLGMHLDIWSMQRHWSNIIECREPGTPLEPIHILVLAQVLNRAIIVLPIESMKLGSFVARDSQQIRLKHPVEGFYPQLPGLNNFRLCPPILLGYINGNYHAMILPPRPVIFGPIETGRVARIHRYLRAPPFPVAEFIQFIIDEEEIEDIVIDTDASGQKWIFHTSLSPIHQKADMSTSLWEDWIRVHFPKCVRDDTEITKAVAPSEDKPADEKNHVV